MELPAIQQYEVKNYSSGYIENAQRLFSKCFGGRLFPFEMWQWQHNDNPCLKNRVTMLWDDARLVAVTVITAKRAFLYGKECVIGLNGTTMVDAEYPGVSLQLLNECIKQNFDITLVYGFPNKNSYRILTKYVGFNHVADVCAWTKRPCVVRKNERVEKIQFLTKEHAALYSELVKDHIFITIRDEKYLDWRFNKKPEADYRKAEYRDDDIIRGYVVYDTYQEGEEQHYQIIDIVAVTEIAFRALIEFVVGEAYVAKADLVKLWLTSDRYKENLVELGFDYGYQPFRLCIWNNDIDIGKCYLTMSDSDIF